MRILKDANNAVTGESGTMFGIATLTGLPLSAVILYGVFRTV